MKYLITDTSIIRINERAGLIQNIGQSESVELSDNSNFVNSYVLYPLNERFFNRRLYARVYGSLSQPAELNVATFIAGGGSTSADTTDDAYDNDVNGYIDNIFSGGDDNSADNDVDGYLDGIFDGGDDNSADDDFDDYLDDIYSNAG